MVAVGRWPGQGMPQVRQLSGGELRPSRACSMTAILYTARAVTVIAPGDLPDPVGGIACESSHCGGRHTTGQQPEEMPVTAFDGI